jgi:hypothetical protein
MLRADGRTQLKHDAVREVCLGGDKLANHPCVSHSHPSWAGITTIDVAFRPEPRLCRGATSDGSSYLRGNGGGFPTPSESVLSADEQPETRQGSHRFYARLGYNPTHQGFTKYFDSD